MFKVLIVDDEPYIRQGLKSIIDWEQYGFIICGEASDGEEGVKQVIKLSPDLVITDIKMPVMDGLEFIKHSKNILGSNAHFIVLSGYNDFKYARSSIKYGVIDYLLKPIEEVELIEILKKIARQIIGDKLNITANQIIQALLVSDLDPDLLLVGKDLFTNISEFRIRFVQIEINISELFEKFDEIELQSKLDIVVNILEKAIYKENINCLYNSSLGNYGIILSKSILKYYYNDAEKFVNDLFKRIDDVLKGSCLIIVGKEISELSDIKTSYKSCLEGKYYNPFHIHNTVIFYDEVKKTQYNYDYIDDASVEKFLEAVEKNQDKITISIINEGLNNISNKKVAPEILHAFFMIFISKVITSVSKKYGNNNDFMKNTTTLYGLEGSNLDEVQEYLLIFSRYIYKYIKSLKNSKQTILIYDIEKYIKNNYQLDLTLIKISEIFFINPVYLGQLLKKSLGMYFNDYLHYIRIEEAKKNLRRSDLKLCEIANKVGYSDSNYFISKFEKITGMSPTEYKNSK